MLPFINLTWFYKLLVGISSLKFLSQGLDLKVLWSSLRGGCYYCSVETKLRLRVSCLARRQKIARCIQWAWGKEAEDEWGLRQGCCLVLAEKHNRAYVFTFNFPECELPTLPHRGLISWLLLKIIWLHLSCLISPVSSMSWKAVWPFSPNNFILSQSPFYIQDVYTV